MASPDQEKKDVKKIKLPTAKKRELQNKKRRLQNRAQRARIRSEVKDFRELSKEIGAAEKSTELSLVYSLIDKAAKKGIFKLNKANRLKSRLALASNA
jgi:small subunit ribosomal protein S20